MLKIVILWYYLAGLSVHQLWNKLLNIWDRLHHFIILNHKSGLNTFLFAAAFN